jgi:hypothetical protein
MATFKTGSNKIKKKLGAFLFYMIKVKNLIKILQLHKVVCSL